MLQFKPGTDVALLNALMHVIVEEELFDRQYIQAHTDGFENMREHLKEFSPERMAAICGIDAKYPAHGGPCVRHGAARDHLLGHGHQPARARHRQRALPDLAGADDGQVGRPGTGLHPLRGQNNVQGASDAGLIPMMFPDYGRVTKDAVRERFEELWAPSSIPSRA